MAKTSRTHFLIYYVKTSASYIITTPRLWADANPNHFKSSNPRDIEIEKYLISNFGFSPIPDNKKTVVLHHFSPNIPNGANGKSFY